MTNTMQKLQPQPKTKKKAAGKTKTAPASKLTSICVFCGSGPGRNPAYVAAARTLGRNTLERKFHQ